jgi:hypothetical protein
MPADEHEDVWPSDANVLTIFYWNHESDDSSAWPTAEVDDWPPDPE